MITTEDKRRICARAFYQGNRDQYEDFHEAAAEFLSGHNVSDDFINTVVKPFIVPAEGHVIFVRDDGHVAALRESDEWFELRTDMTQEEGKQVLEKFQNAADEFPGLELTELVKKIGWRQI